MANPAGVRCKIILSGSGGVVHVYSSSERIILQVRRDVPTEVDILGASFKSAVELSPKSALELAGELLSVSSRFVGVDR